MVTVLTGIKPTGTPHIGNFVGAIKPALDLAADPTRRTLFFIADYHALTTVEDKKELAELTYEVAATWLACGLDPAKSLFYRQSDILETFELSWILACRCAKGLMNRAHAYKARVAENREAGRDEDDGVNMGVYTYPILMAADILLFRTNIVPVGEDQVQHVEMARDLAENFQPHVRQRPHGAASSDRQRGRVDRRHRRPKDEQELQEPDPALRQPEGGAVSARAVQDRLVSPRGPERFRTPRRCT